jgi:hypothetical protein
MGKYETVLVGELGGIAVLLIIKMPQLLTAMRWISIKTMAR